MTQAYPTNFHTFHTRKVLVGDEKPSDFKEVTAADKATIEAKDAKWVRPPQSFIDRWNSAWGNFGCYNENSGFFEGNTLTDITYREAILIDLWGNKIVEKSFSAAAATDSFLIRTNMPPIHTEARMTLNLSSLFLNQQKMEVCNLTGTNYGWVTLMHPVNTWLTSTFNNCQRLRKIIGILNLTYYIRGDSVFQMCKSLEDVKIFGLVQSIDLSDCSKLSLQSFRYLVDNSNATSTIITTVHAEVYAKLTDETNTEWHQVLLDAAEKNITFATPT